MEKIDNIENKLGTRKYITAFFGVLIAALLGLSGLFISMGKGISEKQNIDKQYDINSITKLTEKDFEEKQKEQNLYFSNPLDLRYENDNFIIKCSTYESEHNSQTNTSISGYQLGEYRFSTTKKGVMVLEVIRNRMNVFLEKDKNTIIKVIAYGSADGTPVKQNLKYNGEFGYSTKEIKYFKNNNAGKPFYKKFIVGQTIMTNTDFALLRAYDIVEYLTNRFSFNEENIKIFVNEYDKIGERYRRCDFQITLEDVLLLRNKDYENLSWSARQFIP